MVEKAKDQLDNYPFLRFPLRLQIQECKYPLPYTLIITFCYNFVKDFYYLKSLILITSSSILFSLSFSLPS